MTTLCRRRLQASRKQEGTTRQRAINCTVKLNAAIKGLMASAACSMNSSEGTAAFSSVAVSTIPAALAVATSPATSLHGHSPTNQPALSSSWHPLVLSFERAIPHQPPPKASATRPLSHQAWGFHPCWQVQLSSSPIRAHQLRSRDCPMSGLMHCRSPEKQKPLDLGPAGMQSPCGIG